MSIIITRKDCTLSEANAFYNIEASNLSMSQSATSPYDLLTTARNIPITFANAGNFKGVVLNLFCVSYTSRIVVVTLQENVASVWTTRATKSLTWSQIAGMDCTVNTLYGNGVYTKNFTDFDNVIAVDTTAGKWRIQVSLSGVGNPVYIMRGYDNVNWTYAAYCDNLKTQADGDTVIFAHYCDVDKTTNLNSVLGTGDTVFGTSGIICCNSSTPDVENVCFLRCLNPAASYTLTINGALYYNGHAGVRIGTSTSRIPTANRFNLVFGTATVGTARGAMRSSYYAASLSSSNYSSRASLFLYGAVDCQLRTTTTANLAVGATVVPVAEDMSLKGWTAGDLIVIGKQDVIGAGSNVAYTIQSISGTNITLTSGILTNARISGATVANITETKFGISVKSSTTTLSQSVLSTMSNLNAEGVYFQDVSILGSTNSTNQDEPDANISKMTIKNCVSRYLSTTNYYNFSSHKVNRIGLDVDNCIAHNGVLIQVLTSLKTKAFTSGPSTYNNIYVLSKYNGYFAVQGKTKFTVTNCGFENGRVSYDFLFDVSPGSLVKDIYSWGLSNTVTEASFLYGAVTLPNQSIGATFENIKIDKASSALFFGGASVVLNNTFKNVVIGGEAANTYDVNVVDGALIDSTFDLCNGFTTYFNTDLTGTTIGTKMRFTNYGDVDKVDFTNSTYGIFTRTGGSLADTTTHTVGSDKYAIRFENTLQGNPLEWSIPTPTGNVQNKEVVVAVWCKLNSANYWTGTYTMPRVTVNYDGGVSSAYAEAAKTTEWQLLFVPVTQLTTSGQIEIILSTDTNVTGSDAYVYFDDSSIFYPPGVQLQLGGLDLWANGLPIVPPIATNINATDVWAYPASSATATGSIGKHVTKKLLTLGKFLGLQ